MIADGRYEVASHTIEVRSAPATHAIPETAPVLYWIMMAAHRDNAKTMAKLIAERSRQPFRLVACNVNDWDHELSPWPAENVTGQDDFTGEAPRFLSWLLWDCIPLVEGWEQTRDPIDRTSHDEIPRGRPQRVIGGYSMAGLFAAWAFLKKRQRAFSAMVSASGSLWFPGWLAWAERQPAPQDSVTYLSLGAKEPRVKNPIVASVGDATERTATLLSADEAGAHLFVWNNGGHFHEPSERMASGFAWTLDHLEGDNA